MSYGEKVTAIQLVLSAALAIGFSIYARARWGRNCNVLSAKRSLLWHAIPAAGLPFLMGHLFGTDVGVAHLCGYLIGGVLRPEEEGEVDEQGMRFTTAFVLAFVAWQIVYDIFAIVYWGNDATISMVVRRASMAAPALGFAFGMIAGNLFGLDRRIVLRYVAIFAFGVLFWGQMGDSRYRGYFKIGGKGPSGDEQSPDRR